MFGQQKPAGSLFGSFGQTPQQQNQQPSTSLFGQPTTGSNLFGGSNTSATTSTQPNTNLFGNATAQNNTQQPQQQQTPNIFGQPAATATPMFGNTTAQNNAQQPQQQQTPNIFGQPAANATPMFGGASQPSQQSTPSTNLFGSTTNQVQPSTSLFGTSTTTPTTTGLFGNSLSTQQQQQAPQPSQGFGQTNIFGNTTQNQQSQPSTTAYPNTPLFTRTTKFNDLPEEVRKKFEQIDSHIQGRVQISSDLKQRKLGEEPQKGSEDIRSVHKDLVSGMSNLRADVAAMRELRNKMDQAVQDTIATTRLIDSFKAPAQQLQPNQSSQGQNTAWLKQYASFPLEFFTRVTTQLQERLQWITNALEQIERKLISESNHVSVTPQAITSTLQAQHASFVALASKAAALDAELQQLKNTYRTLWRARTGSARDPFNERDHGASGTGEFGLDGLRTGVA